MFRLSWNNDADRQKMIEIIRSGGVIAGTTDTVVGLFASITFDGYAKLNRIKQRKNKPYLVLVADLERALVFIDLKDHKKIRDLAKKYWPGPTTLICNTHDSIADFVAPQGKIALRVPDNEYIVDVLQSFDGLFSTSANIAGNPIPETINQLDQEICIKIDSVIVQNSENKKIEPSMILDVTGDEIVVIRE